MKKYCKYCYKKTEHYEEEFWKCLECGSNNFRIKEEEKKDGEKTTTQS